MNYGAFRPRTPPLPRRPGYYDPKREGFPPLIGPTVVPVIQGGDAYWPPTYPQRQWPFIGPVEDDQIGLRCPPGTRPSMASRQCIPIGPAYSGYVDPEVAKKWSWRAFGAGLGAMGATFSMGMVPSLLAQKALRRKGDPNTGLSILPSLLPALGAGILAYFLGLELDNCQRAAAPILPVPPAHPEISAQEMQDLQWQMAGRFQCPAGQEWSETQGRCVDILI